MSSSDAGCDYNNDYQTAIYGTKKVSSIPVSVRYYQDSFISASEMTGGCSSDNPSSTSCFGMSRKEQDKLGYILSTIGVIFFVVEIGVFVYMCIFCKEMISSLSGKKKKKSLPKTDNNTIPAQPVQPNYMPTQPTQPVQPNYMPTQPTQPVQPNYMPTQPTQPGQPNYMPTTQPGQPNYMPTTQPGQPNYMPTTQPGYAPYYPQQQY